MNKKMIERINLGEWASPTQHNIVIELFKNGSMNRKQLVNSLKKPRTTIFDNLNRLQKRNIVSKFPKNTGDRGRPEIFWKLNMEEK